MKSRILPAIALSCFVTTHASAGLLGYWDFETDFADQSGNGNDGVPVGTAVIDNLNAAIGSGSVNFANAADDSYVNINPGTGMRIADNAVFSLSMWFTSNEQQNDERLFSEGSTTNANPLYNIGTGNNAEKAPSIDFFRRTGDGTTTNNHEISFATPFGDDEWHHMVIVDSSGTVELYIDGVLDTTFNYTDSSLDSDTTTFGGILRSGPCCGFTGNLDDIAVWDEALTPEQIASLADKSQSPPDLVIPISDADMDGMRDDFEQQIIDADPGDAIETIADVLPGDDYDEDGSTNEAEEDNFTDPTDPDSDDDNLNDGEETLNETNPNNPDSDGDTLLDGDEVALGIDPNSPDTDGDGISDPTELDNGSDPNDPDSPGLADGESLTAYWPLDTTDGTTTPDEGPNGYDLMLNNMDASNFVAGKVGNAAMFNGIDELLSRIHTEGEFLPITNHPAYTVSMWVNVVGTGQNDLRMFSEGSTTSDVPLFNIGTKNNGVDGRLDMYIRPSGGPAHEFSTAEPLDGTWRHIAVTGNAASNTLQVYIDGVLDTDALTFRDLQGLGINTTTVGGILRANPSHWVNGLVDDVSLWRSVLSEEDVLALAEGTNPLDLAGGGVRFEVTEVTYDGNDVTLTWNSKPGRVYAVFASRDNANGGWDTFELDDSFPSQGEQTTYVYPGELANPPLDPAAETRLFFRIREGE